MVRESKNPKIAKIKEDLINFVKERDDDGQVIIIKGEPGTGKTLFLRSVLNAL